jgi:5-methylcytosine-specific restriction enzyme A
MRIEFTSATKRLMYERSGGICECHRVPAMSPCGRPLGPGNTFYEHVIQCALGGDNSPDNGAVLTRTCWKLKTSKQDLPVIAKVKRIRDRHRGIVARGRRIMGWRRFDGTPVRRT